MKIATILAIRPRSSSQRKGRIPVNSIPSSRGRRLAWSRGFTPPRGYQSPVMDGDPGALVTPRRSGPEVVGSNPTGPTTNRSLILITETPYRPSLLHSLAYSLLRYEQIARWSVWGVQL